MIPLKIAVNSLKSNKIRTTLTVLGIIIGIAVVIIVMSAGEGLKKLILDQVEAFGSDIIQVEIKVPATAHASAENAMGQAMGIQITTMTLEDGEAIEKLPNVKNHYVWLMGQEVVSYLDQNRSTNIIGTLPSFIEVDQSTIESGRFFTKEENDNLARVAVLGYKMAEKLFGGADPLGNDIKIGNLKFKIVGVLEERGATFGMDIFDDVVYLPVKSLQKLLMGIDHVQAITVQIHDQSIEEETAEDIRYLLRERRDTTDPDKDDFGVMSMTEAREMIDVIFNGITLLLIAIAGISLLVGGIGIMNIMYVSVSERTFEIGLRKALGAKKNNILWQFLAEAVILTLIGGILGIALGIIVSYLIGVIAGLLGLDWSFVLPPSSIIIAFGFCGFVGLVFGYYPARKAAKMDPIIALKHEKL